MAHPHQLKRSLGAVALALSTLAVAPAAQALTFVFTDVGTTPMSAVQLAAFQAAGNYWSNQLTDNVTLYMNISFANLPANVLGSTGSNFTTANYSSFRSALLGDATSASDATAVANLQAGPALTFLATQGDLTSRFDNDGSVNNTLLGLTTANAKAVGLTVTTSAANPDGSIQFANAFASTFAYVRDANGQVPAGLTDFITVAEHEIGHALGFVSGVDDIDFCAGPANACGLPDTVGRFETDWWYEPLDLFRYSAAGQMDVRVGGSPYFSIDGGVTSITAFSTGTEHGNGWQASHFGPNEVNLMRPFVGSGQSYDATARDLTAFDVIGWNLVTTVPEPGTYAMLFAGLVGVAGAARRRRAD